MPIKFIIKLKGKVETTPWFMAGSVESSFMLSLGRMKIFDLNHVFNDNEIIKINMWQGKGYNQLNTKMDFDYLKGYRGTAEIDFDLAKGVFEIKFPKEWFNDYKSFEVTMNSKPLYPDHPLYGGVHTAIISRDDVPFFKVDLDYKFKMNASTYKLILNQIAVESLNADLVRSFFYMLPITKYEFCQHLQLSCRSRHSTQVCFDRMSLPYHDQHETLYL